MRTRESGALQAWEESFRLTGRTGADFRSKLGDCSRSPSVLYEDLRTFMLQSGVSNPQSAQHGAAIPHAGASILSLAFWLRRGALFELTPALDELLGVSDIARDFPIASLRLPAPTVCIVPARSAGDVPRKLDSILLFEHAGQPKAAPGERWITVIASQFPDLRSREGELSILDLRVDGTNDTIDSVIRSHLDHPGHVVERQFWLDSLNYIVKVLLYLQTDTATVRPDNAYRLAPRDFRGLGKRKRAERNATIEQLYDRYIIGPETLPGHAESLPCAPDGQGPTIANAGRTGGADISVISLMDREIRGARSSLSCR